MFINVEFFLKLKVCQTIGQIWSGAMMLDYLGEKEASDRIIIELLIRFKVDNFSLNIMKQKIYQKIKESIF